MSAGRRFSGDTLVIATHNAGKVKEIAALLGDYVHKFPSAVDLALPEPEETETTFIGNAVLKAKAAAVSCGLPALADDSGLAVAALNGQPGIYSARWAGPDKDFARAFQRIQDELGDNPDRSAAFICALALAWPDGHVETVEGRVEGAIAHGARGSGGFGYDPIFIRSGHDRTFAEDPAIKFGNSHRDDAFRKLIALCFGDATGLNSGPASCRIPEFTSKS